MSKILDMIRDFSANLFDFTARAGHLQPQDDLVGGTNLDVLRTQLALRGMKLIDIRQLPRRGRGRALGTRQIENVTAILLHQTASLVSLAQAPRIPCHGLVLEDAVVLAHPVRAYVPHCGAGNKYTIGVEIRCRSAGIQGDLRTLWLSKRDKAAGRTAESLVHEASERQLYAARWLGDYYVAETRQQGGEIKAVSYHRNTSDMRTSDPGQRIALRVGAPLARRYRLEYGGPVVGSGKPTPEIWGGSKGTRYSWRVRGI